MVNQVLFSVVVPTFNAGATLDRCLTSLVAQKTQPLEIIVVDALSTDDTAAILERYSAHLAVVIQERDNGQADAINKGMRRAKGDVVAWLCADDELMPGALDHVAGLFQADRETEVVIGACERIYADGTPFITYVPGHAWKIIGRINVIDQPSVFWRSSLQQRLGPLNTSYRLAFDWDLWCRMARAGAKLKITKTVLSRYFFSEVNKTSTAGTAQAIETFQVIRTHGPLGGKLAHVYRVLYYVFDLHGCYDAPPTCTRMRGYVFTLSLRLLKATLGEELAYGYNLQYASRQQRGLKWW